MAENKLSELPAARGLGVGVEKSKSDEEGKTVNVPGESSRSGERVWFS